MANNNLGIILVLLLVGVGIFIYYNYQDKLDIEYEGDLEDNTGIKITVTQYDKDGNIVKTTSDVMAVEEITLYTIPDIEFTTYSYDIKIDITNTGNVDLDISVSDFMLTGDFKT